MIKTFIFDLGNVIVPFELDRGVKILGRFCDTPAERIREKIFASEEVVLFETGKITAAEFFIFLENLLDLRMDFDQFAAAWNSIFSPEPLISTELIKRLSDKYRLLILSDTNKLHFDFIRREFPVLGLFDDFVLSYQVGYQKPAPEIFQAAVEKALCRPNECFFTDDRPGNIAGAGAFGIRAIQFVSAGQFERDLKKRRLL